LSELADIAKRKGDLLGAIDATRHYNEAQTHVANQFTAASLGKLHDAAAVHLLGTGKSGADLSDMAKGAITSRFVAWVESDPERINRYNAFDAKLGDEFWPLYRAAVYDPIRRADSVAALTSHEGRPALPQGGAQAAPVAPAPPQPAVPADEDAIHERSWALAQQ
jgi:hypothetical protein